jgi:hypothetical protein
VARGLSAAHSTLEAPSGVLQRVTPRSALVAIVAGVVLAYGVLGVFVTTPRIFYDELIYMEAGDSLAHGDSPQVREGPYEYGILYPAVLAPVLWASSDREVGYELAKMLNALLFALAAVPVYLLARRLLRPWPSVAVAGLAVAVPSAVYVSVVMTESLAYVLSSCAIYAIVMATERPSVLRQFAALGTIGVAYLARPQFLALSAAFVAALALAIAIAPSRRARWRSEVRTLWPTLLSAAGGVAVFVLLPLARGNAPQERLGRYQDLWRSYDVLTVGRWLLYHASDLDLYLAVVPVAVAPVFLAFLYARARAGGEREGAFLATFASVNAAMLAVVAIVVTYQESSGSGTQRLHDRYVFYVAPLWLIALFASLQRDTPRPRWAVRLGIALAVVLAALLPLDDIDVNDGAKLFSAVGTGLPGIVSKVVDPAFAVGRLLLAAAALALVWLVFRSGRPLRVALFALAFVFVVDASLAWGHAFAPPERKVFAGGADERLWVDENVPAGADVQIVSVDCPHSTLVRDSFFETEFFNSAVGRVAQVGGAFPDARVTADGSVVRDSGGRMRTTYVVAPPGVRVEGRQIARGTAAGLTLWRTDGVVRLVGIHSVADLYRRACRGE